MLVSRDGHPSSTTTKSTREKDHNMNSMKRTASAVAIASIVAMGLSTVIAGPVSANSNVCNYAQLPQESNKSVYTWVRLSCSESRTSARYNLNNNPAWTGYSAWTTKKSQQTIVSNSPKPINGLTPNAGRAQVRPTGSAITLATHSV